MHKVCDGVRGGSIRGVWGGVKCYSEDRFIETQVFKFSGLKDGDWTGFERYEEAKMMRVEFRDRARERVFQLI